VPKLRITLSAIQPALRGATLSASGDDAAPRVLWLRIGGADFKSQRSSTTLTHAACTIVGLRWGALFDQRLDGEPSEGGSQSMIRKSGNRFSEKIMLKPRYLGDR
jgi:hypothetical protein